MGAGAYLVVLAFFCLAPSVDCRASDAAGGASPPPELKILCGSVGKEFSMCQQGVARCVKKLGTPVEVVPAVNGSNERLALYGQFFAAKSPDVDVFQVDVTWPPMLAPHLIDLKPHLPKGDDKDFHPVSMENNVVDGKLLALPWFADTAVLFYRKDLLEKYKKSVPTTWSELFATAREIQDAERKAGQASMWGYVFQGKAYEGLTVNALEWVTSSGADFYDKQGVPALYNPQVVATVKLIAGNVGETIPAGVLNYAEEDARGVFQSGNAVFMRNWLYAQKLAEAEDSPIKGKVGIALLPKGDGPSGRHVGALGGWQLGVSKYSKNPKEAAALAVCLTSEAEQRHRALEGGYTPTRLRLRGEEAVDKALGHLEFFADGANQSLRSRPSRVTGRKYNQFSTAVWTTFHDILKDGKKAASTADKKLEQLSKRIKMFVTSSGSS